MTYEEVKELQKSIRKYCEQQDTNGYCSSDFCEGCPANSVFNESKKFIKVLVHITNIEWDVDEGEGDNLPTEVTNVFSADEVKDVIGEITDYMSNEAINDWLSDNYGYCLVSFNANVEKCYAEEEEE